MGRNRITELSTIVLLCAAGCAKPGLEGARKKLITDQARKSPRATLAGPEPPEILPSTHFAAGRMFEAQGHLAKAVEQYQKAIVVAHTHVAAHHRLGLIYSQLGKHDEAIRMFRKAIVLEPDNAVLRNNLGFELMYKREWREAAVQLSQAIAIQPNFARAHVNLGMTLSRLNRYDDALAHFRAVLPEQDAQYNLGLMYRAGGRHEDAAKAFQHILDTDPNFQAAQTQLADITPYLSSKTGSEVEETPKIPRLTDNRNVERHETAPTAADPVVSPVPEPKETVAQQRRPEPTVVPPSTTRAISDTKRNQQAEPTPVMIEPAAPAKPVHQEKVGKYERPEPAITSPTTMRAAVAPTPEQPNADEVVAGQWFTGEVSEEHFESAPATEVFQLEEPSDYDELVSKESADDFFADFEDAGEPAHIDPIVVEQEDETIVGNFVADYSEPVIDQPCVDLTTDIVTPKSVGNDLDRSTAGNDEPGMLKRTVEAPSQWRNRLRALGAELSALRDEIDCLHEVDADLTSAHEPTHATPAAEVAATPSTRKTAKVTKRENKNRRHRSADPRMMLAYKPTATRSTHAAPPAWSNARWSEPAAGNRSDDLAPPLARARPVEELDTSAAVEVGPSLPAHRVEAAGLDWDAQFRDLHDLLSITQNEIRCWEEFEETVVDDRVTDGPRSTNPHHKTRAKPVRYRPRRNPFYDK